MAETLLTFTEFEIRYHSDIAVACVFCYCTFDQFDVLPCAAHRMRTDFFYSHAIDSVDGCSEPVSRILFLHFFVFEFRFFYRFSFLVSVKWKSTRILSGCPLCPEMD